MQHKEQLSISISPLFADLKQKGQSKKITCCGLEISGIQDYNILSLIHLLNQCISEENIIYVDSYPSLADMRLGRQNKKTEKRYISFYLKIQNLSQDDYLTLINKMYNVLFLYEKMPQEQQVSFKTHLQEIFGRKDFEVYYDPDNNKLCSSKREEEKPSTIVTTNTLQRVPSLEYRVKNQHVKIP